MVQVDLSEETHDFFIRQTPSGGSNCTTESAWWIPVRFKTKVLWSKNELFCPMYFYLLTVYDFESLVT